MKTPEQTIIEKTLNNEATPQQARQVAAWLATPEGQQWLAERMARDMESMEEGREEEYIDHPIPSAEMLAVLMKKIHRQKIRKSISWAAAIVIPLVLFSSLFIELNSRVDLFAGSDVEEVYVPKGERMQVIFQDGSKAFLNSETRIRFPKKFGLRERQVELEGEAWFDVASQKNRPFVVDLKVLDVRVLGTTFDVKAYADDADIAVALESGSVQLNGNTFRTVTMQPGQKALYNRKSGQCTIAYPEDVSLSSAWKGGLFVFRNAPLPEVLKTLGRNFDVEFIIENPAVRKYSIVLHTKYASLPLILEELEKINPVKFEIEGKVVRVK